MKVRKSPQINKDFIYFCKWTFATLCFIYTMNLSSRPGRIWQAFAFLARFSMSSSKKPQRVKERIAHLPSMHFVTQANTRRRDCTSVDHRKACRKKTFFF